jgi:hypothetical protein
MKPLFVISCPIDTYTIRILKGQLFINKVWDLKQVSMFSALIAQKKFINKNGNCKKQLDITAVESVQARDIVFS